MIFAKKALPPLLFSCVFTNSAFSADIEAGVVINLTGTSDSTSNGVVLSNFPHDGIELLSNLEGTSSSDDSSIGGITTFAAANGISYFEIGIVYSSDYGDYEGIYSYQTSTVADHGGDALYIYAWQYGYGNPGTATMNGNSVDAGYSQYRCGTDLHVCTTGETITGWLYGWDFSGESSGFVTVSTNSTASPFGYWSDSLNIK